jgi:subtilisin family serine protease
MRVLAALLLAGGLGLAGTPAHAAETPVSLVVGLRADSDVVDSLAGHVDVLQAEPLSGAVAVDVPASQAAAAADALREDPAVAYVERDHVAYAAAVTPDDPGFPAQWGIPRTGVDDAWTTSRGSGDIVVAVVDTGVRKLPDLAPRLLAGRDFVNDDTDADDDNGHGTMAAGVLGATAGNGTGIAGICWYCRILPVKVLGADGSGSYTDIAEGIRYAADRGADIINLSLGGSADSHLLRDAVAYAAGKGALVVAAAGNAGSPAPHYPAAIPAALAVGASTADDTRYPWSNHGSDWVDIAAPGCNPAQTSGGALGQFCGTSSATPFVSGVAALLAAADPRPSAATIRRAMTLSAAALPGDWVAAGSGRVDAAAALAAATALRTDSAAPSTSFRFPAASALVRGTVPIGARAGDDVGVGKVELLAGSRVVATDTTSPYAFRWTAGAYHGPVTLTLRAYDRAGNVTLARRTVLVDNTGPAVLIARAPATGTRDIRGTAYVTARASDPNGVQRLELLVNGRPVQRYAGTLKEFAVPTAQYGKVIRVQVRAYDRAGNVRSTPVRTWYR